VRFGIGFFFGNDTDGDRIEALERGQDGRPGVAGDARAHREQLARRDRAEPLGVDTPERSSCSDDGRNAPRPAHRRPARDVPRGAGAVPGVAGPRGTRPDRLTRPTPTED
jgi:hypothetical protein